MIQLPAAVAAEANQDATWPVRLFEIGGVTPLYYTDAAEDVAWQGRVYAARGISYAKAEVKLGFEVDTYTVAIDNHDDAMTGWILQSDNKGYWSQILKGFATSARDASGRITLVDDFALLLFAGENTSFSINNEAEITVKSELDLHEQIGPKATQQVTCRFRFKDRNCGYSGAETRCNLTGARCDQLGNKTRFGGFEHLSAKTS